MRIIAIRMLREFWQEPTRGDAEQALKAWFSFTSAADWNTPADVKLDYRNASILKIRRVVSNIAGNKYRLVVSINYPYRVVYLRFVGTHAQYDQIDAETI